MISEILREPVYFTVLAFSRICVSKFKLPKTYGDAIYIVEFRLAGLEHPLAEPIGMFQYAGIWRYIWNNHYWNEIDIDYSNLISKTLSFLSSDHVKFADYRLLLRLLRLYGSAQSPHGVVLPSRGGNGICQLPIIIGNNVDRIVQTNDKQVFCRAMLLLGDA